MKLAPVSWASRPSALAAGAVGVALVATMAIGEAERKVGNGARCGAGFVAVGARCAPSPSNGSECPSPLVALDGACDAPDERVLVPAATLAIGPSDWEAEGLVGPRTLVVDAFRLDAFEVTERRLTGRANADGARAASGMPRGEAARFCASRGGRLPTEDEWVAAAVSSSNPPARYPWGDTGAVCRRGAWGLSAGPCATGASGPDTVGAHPDGDTRLGLHDMAGNVAEWVAPPSPAQAVAPPMTPAFAPAIAKGGSWKSALASDLRIWARLELPAASGDARVGFRCAYPP